MREFTYTITDAHGIHARPAGLLAAAARQYTASVKVSCGDRTADGKRLLALMTLEARCGDRLSFRIEGDDEDQAAEAILRTCGEVV